MAQAYLLPPGREALPPNASPLRLHATLPSLSLDDAAVRAMSDFDLEAPLAVGEDAALDETMDDMLLLGVRALLVVRERTVIGLIGADDAGRQALRRRSQRAERVMLRVADVMIPATDVPAIDFHTLCESRISDLVEIFDGAGVDYLVVLDNESSRQSCVRGMVHRSRLQRQLAGHWPTGRSRR